MLRDELIELTSELKKWYQVSLPPQTIESPPLKPPTLAVAPKKELPPPPVASEPSKSKPAPSKPIAKPSEMELWAKQHFKIQAPITPIICIGNDPMLQKLCEALSSRLAPSTCQMTLPNLSHPLLKLVLIPLIQIAPEIKANYPNLQVHTFTPPFLPLHPLFHYTQHIEAKKELWNTILQLPLFCST